MLKKTIAALVAGSLSLSAVAAVENFDFDVTHTYPSFEVNHLGFSITRGFFKENKGTLTLDREAKKGSVEVVIDAKSIETGLAKRDEHLRAKDFFNIEQFPTVSFKSSNFKFDGANPVEAAGELTMLGVTKPVTLKINPMKCDIRFVDKNYVCGADVTTTIKRSEWGMKAYVPFVGDDVKIAVQVEAVRKQTEAAAAK